LLHLAINEFAQRADLRIFGAAQTKDFEGVAYRRERIAQLVSEHGKKLVLVPIRFLDIAIEAGVVQSDGGSFGQVFGQRSSLWACDLWT